MTAKKKYKKGDIIICEWCGKELVITHHLQQFHKECTKEKSMTENKERCREYWKKKCSEKQENTEMPRVSMLASKNALAREKKLTYGQLEAQKYIRENNIGVKI